MNKTKKPNSTCSALTAGTNTLDSGSGRPITSNSYSDRSYTAHIALICDTAYVVPTCVTIYSIFNSAPVTAYYDVIVVTAELSESARILLNKCAGPRGTVRVVTGDMSKYNHLHIDTENSVRVASPAALLKFDLPELLPELDKVLYLDSDIIVRGDLSPLFETDLSSEKHLIAAAADSGQVYFKHEYTQRVNRYFNSGVMLMNLELMREEHLPEKLLAEKRANPHSNLMDQNVFNVVMDGRVRYLEPVWNFLYVNLCNAAQSYSIDQINDLFGTHYADIGDIEQQAQIIHYSSKNKPWKTPCTALSDEWYRAYLNSSCAGITLERDNAPGRPCFSVVVYMKDHGPYIEQCITSLRTQTINDIEVLLVDNGSKDNSVSIAKNATGDDKRIRLLRMSGNPCEAANAGLRLAYGDKVLFLDGCEMLSADALERLDNLMNSSGADMAACTVHTSIDGQEHIIQEFSANSSFVDAVSMCINCEPEGWPRAYSRSFLERNRLFFDNRLFRGPSFALACADYAAKGVYENAAVITRLHRSSRNPQYSTGSIDDMFNYMLQLKKHSAEEGLSSLVQRHMDQSVAAYTAMRNCNLLQGVPAADANFGSLEQTILRCAQLEDQKAKAEELLSRSRAEYLDIAKSTSYRIGKTITAIPRRIKQLISTLLK